MTAVKKFKWRKRKQHKPIKQVVYPADKPGVQWYEVFTDGSALKNPGPGGYGAIVTLGDTELTLSKGFTLTTNNRMEILAVVATLEEFGPNKRFKIYTDSQYVIDGATKWVKGWVRNNWLGQTGQSIKNRDLWEQLKELLDENEVRFIKVKAHSGVPLNERVDRVAKDAAGNPTDVDHGYPV